MINSIWISGIGKLDDVHVPETLKQANCVYGEHDLLSGLSKYLGIPHQKELPALSSSDLVGGFGWFYRPDTIWPTLKQALLGKTLDEITIIDFPKGATRERTFKAADLFKKSFAFWRKAQELSWKEITQP